MNRLTKLAVRGSTGLIGVSTLDVVGRHPERYSIHAMIAGQNAGLLATQILRFRPKVVVVATEEIRRDLIGRLNAAGLARSEWPELDWGPQARVTAATASARDFVMSAPLGVAGLGATHEAIVARKRTRLADKTGL